MINVGHFTHRPYEWVRGDLDKQALSLTSERDIHGRRNPTHATGDSSLLLMRRLQPRFLLGVHQVYFHPPSARWHCHIGWIKIYVEDDKRITECFPAQGKQGTLSVQTATKRSVWLTSTIADTAYGHSPKRCCSSEEWTMHKTVCI